MKINSVAQLRDNQCDLRDADLTGLDLSYTSLRNLDLTGADCSCVDFAGADLTDCKLSFANLSGANLIKANLTRARLFRANLCGANLSYSHMTQTNLMEANMYNASLRGADIMRASLDGANLSKANLRNVGVYVSSLVNANLSGANLRGAILNMCVPGMLKGCILTEAKGVIDLGDDTRGYRFIAVQGVTEGYNISAGCHWFTPPEAEDHWSSRHHGKPDLQRKIHAILRTAYKQALALGWIGAL